MFSALVPSGATSLTLAPWFSSTFAASAWPFRTANRKLVHPAFDLAPTSAPDSMSTPDAAALPFDAAHINAVCPLYGSFVFTLAPWATSTLMAATFPVSEAVISAVWPSSDVPFASAPAFSSRSTIDGVAVRAGQRERRHVVARGGAGIRAGGQENVHHGRVVAPGGPVKRGRAIGLGGIHIHALRDERRGRSAGRPA